MPYRRPLWEVQAEADREKDPVRLAVLAKEIFDRKIHYSYGWRSSNRRSPDLEKAEDRYTAVHGENYWHDWMDGWMDVACGRPFRHLQFCLNHEETADCIDWRTAKGEQHVRTA